nr:crosslink repair DNA glycosylase YcaQ family protein [Brachybacterium sacelli]
MGRARRTDVPGPAASRRALRRTLEHTHLLQIDSVSVFERAHHLPVFTRTGSWDPAVLDRLSRPGPGRLVREALAHEATYATHEVHALLDFRRRAAARRDWGQVRVAATSSPQLFTRIFETLEELGPSSAAAISRHLGDTERGEGWGWRRTRSQWAVEYLFRSGALDCVGRSPQFERLYVATEDAPPQLEVPAGPGAQDDSEGAEDDPARAGSIRALMALAARSLGIAEVTSLADYFRVPVRDAREAAGHLEATGEVRRVRVGHPSGAREMLLHRDAPKPTPLRASALVSPFDPLVFHRPRLSRLFDVEYRIGIYTPEDRRSTGYYSLLFLHGDVFPALVDLKADRARGVLEVRGTFREELPHLPARQRPADVAVLEALVTELRRAASWQGLDRVEVRTGPRTGDLAEPLAALLAAPPSGAWVENARSGTPRAAERTG